MNVQTIRLLLVEDNPGDARLVQEMLAETGRDYSGERFKMSHASNLDQALARLAEQPFDLVLLDLALPDSHGLETLTRMLSAAPHLPVVVMSGLGDREVAVEAVKAGAQDYLVKGYLNPFALSRSILYAMERYRTQQDIERRNRELALLNKIIAVSTTATDTTEIFETVCVELAQTFETPRATAILFSENQATARIVAQFVAEEQPTAVGMTFSLAGDPVAQQVIAHNAPVVIKDAQTDPHLASFHEAVRQYGIVSMLILPVRINNQVIGTLTLETTEPRTFSAEEYNLAWSVADQVAGAVARVRIDQERRLLSTAVEKTVENVMITDPDSTILYVNKAFEQTTGYDRVDVLGKTPQFLNSGKQDAQFYRELWTAIKAGQVWEGQFTNRKKDGTLFTEKATITPVIDDDGQIANYVAVKRDITQQLLLEEKHRQAQRMESVGRLAGGIAHDFNNLLTVVIGYAELLLARHHSPEDPSHQDLELIRKSSERAATLTRQLLAFSRREVIKPIVINLNDTIADIGKMLQRLIGENIELMILPDEELGQVKADPGQIEQIIMNLALNARDAMHDGGKLTIETANVYLDETYAGQHVDIETGWYVMLAVTDTGSGMEPETQARIFEPFFTTKGEGKGTGLGLATVYGIVKQSNGTIWVYSEPDWGTTFKIYLPQLESVAEPPTGSRSLSTVAPGTETVLVVEDEEMVQSIVRFTLQSNGYKVLEACNGQEAIQIYQQNGGAIDLLLTDVVIPGDMSGSELSRHLTDLQPDMKVLFMSGYPDGGIAHQGVLQKDVAFLQKPFAPNILAHKVRAVLDADGVM